MQQSELLFITHKYPPSTGGMQKQSFELINHIKAQRKIHTIIFDNSYPKIFFFIIVLPWAWWKIKRNKRINLVHANDGLMALFITPLLRLKKQIVLCATIHGLDIVFNASLYQKWVKKYLSQFDCIIAVSKATKDECIIAGIREGKVHYIPNAVELPDKIEKDPDFLKWFEIKYGVSLNSNFVISSVGRPVPRKGFSWFAEDILPHLKNTKYLVVGTELESSWVIMTAKKILSEQLFERVCKMLGVPLDTIKLNQITRNQDADLILMGKIPQDKLVQVYLHSDIFVMPNFKVKGDFEGFGLVALEAASLGAVCLAADVDGIPSAIQNGVNGYLLESKNTEEWLNKIAELRSNDQLSAAKNNFAQFFTKSQSSWKDMSNEYLKVFDQYLVPLQD